MKKRIIFESIFILVFLFVVYKNYIYNDGKYEKKLNTYYSENNDTDFVLQEEYVERFSKLITNSNYGLAYDMLSDECKSFYGTIENFKEVILKKYANPKYVEKEFLLEIGEQKIEDKVRTTKVIAINMLKDVSEYINMPNTDEAAQYYETYDVNFTVIENAPFDYKIYVEL